MKIKVIRTTNPGDYEKVTPNFIYNRLDMFVPPVEFIAVRIISDAGEKVIEYQITDTKAQLAIWLTPINEAELKALLYFIKNEHPQVKTVSYTNGVIPYGKSKAHNHFKIVFPKSGDEMRQRVSPKSWSKMRRRNRRAREIYGEMKLEEYTRENMPDEVVEKFFEYKRILRNREYNMTPDQYLDRYHVTDVYVVKFGDTMGAMHFLCEQCPVVNGENHSYNPELQEYSLGKFIFAHSLVRIAEKGGHTEIFLAGGDYEYKTHYDSIEETLYDCNITLSAIDFSDMLEKNAYQKFKDFLKAILPVKVVDLIKKVKQILNR